MARVYHVERGEPQRWQVISPVQAYHGPTMATLALTGRPGLQAPFGPYLADHLHIPPSTKRFDPTGEAALEALDRALEKAGPETVSAFFCEPISAASLPAYSPPARFWEGLAERRERHGFLICFDEVVTGMGRTGRWFAAEGLPMLPDIIATAKGLGAGYAAIGAAICREHVYDAVANGSRAFPLGHTWDGAPLSCAVGVAVIDALRSEGLVEHVAARGPPLREELEAALAGIDLVGEVRGHGFLLGVDYVDPRDGRSFLPRELGVAGRIDQAADRNGLLVLSTQPTGDGYAGDQSLFAPPFVTTEADLAEMVRRFAASVAEVAEQVDRELSRQGSPSPAVAGGDAP
jgi:adenosylmethionine-8-amino-7-oxononanoate aminotransferase